MDILIHVNPHFDVRVLNSTQHQRRYLFTFHWSEPFGYIRMIRERDTKLIQLDINNARMKRKDKYETRKYLQLHACTLGEKSIYSIILRTMFH